jgi:hypothetical protein
LSLSSKIPNYSSPEYIYQAEDKDDNHDNKDKQHTKIITKINFEAKGQKEYIKRILIDISNNSTDNAGNICEFIIAVENEINIKASTVEWHVKVLGQLLKYHKLKF